MNKKETMGSPLMSAHLKPKLTNFEFTHQCSKLQTAINVCSGGCNCTFVFKVDKLRSHSMLSSSSTTSSTSPEAYLKLCSDKAQSFTSFLGRLGATNLAVDIIANAFPFFFSKHISTKLRDLLDQNGLDKSNFSNSSQSQIYTQFAFCMGYTQRAFLA